jgi:hypothetical protein
MAPNPLTIALLRDLYLTFIIVRYGGPQTPLTIALIRDL